MNMTVEVAIPQTWESALCQEVEQQGFKTLSEYIRSLIVRDSERVRQIINRDHKSAQKRLADYVR